ncbi:MAG: S1-like domain-containing RNA-binding protein [Eubacteriales bacterium]|nr:S1-like domain-containing RNA-binding protein [Eubacteriales bacterium]
MLEIGKKQTLRVLSKQDFGVYLAEDPKAGKEDRVLLPIRQVPEDAEIGTPIEVFLYRDSQDRLIATTREPRLQLGETAVLTVKEVTKIGAFLDWGLEKDLFLPFHEQTLKVRKGEDVLVALYLDKSSRLCATMKVYHYLRTDSPYKKGDMVKGRIYERSRNFGVFVAVEDQYSAMIPKKDAQAEYTPGQVLDMRITAVHEDGKLDVTARQKAYLQMDTDAEMIMKVIEAEGGELTFDDKAAPEVISGKFGISKAAFKRAVGHLLKERKIRIEEGQIVKND